MKDFWAAEASNVMGSLGLGGIFNHTESVYQVGSITAVHLALKSHMNAVRRSQRHAVLLLTGVALSASRNLP